MIVDHAGKHCLTGALGLDMAGKLIPDDRGRPDRSTDVAPGTGPYVGREWGVVPALADIFHPAA